MTTARTSPIAVLTATLAVVGALALFLPWWQALRPAVLLVAGPTRAGDAEVWPGWEVVGVARAVLVGALASATVVAAGARPHRGAPGLLGAVCGAAAGGLGAAAVLGSRVSAGPGAWVALLAGAGAVALPLVGATRATGAAVAAIALVVAVAVPVLPGGAPRPDGGRTSGPFLRLAGLAAPRLDALDLVPVPGGAVRIAGHDGDGHRLERVTPTSGGVDLTVLAGGADPACGLVRTARGLPPEPGPARRRRRRGHLVHHRPRPRGARPPGAAGPRGRTARRAPAPARTGARAGGGAGRVGRAHGVRWR